MYPREINDAFWDGEGWDVEFSKFFQTWNEDDLRASIVHLNVGDLIFKARAAVELHFSDVVRTL